MSLFRTKHLDNLDFCSQRTRSAIRLFCSEIDRSDADIFIVMAQKAICLINILVEQELIDFHSRDKIVICSSALEFGAIELTGKKVAIVDDIIVSGSAIASLANRLIALGVTIEKIQIIGLAKNRKFFSMQFTDENGKNLLYCNKEMEDAECIELSYDLSKIFAFYGRPYDSDFPLFSEQDWDIHSQHQLSNNLLWSLYDISNDIQSNAGILSYVLFPGKEIKDALWKKTGVDLDSVVHLKARIYIKQICSSKGLIKLVPMALLNEIAENEVSSLFDEVVGTVIGAIADDLKWNLSTKFRFLQFYISYQFAKEMEKHLGIGLSLSVEMMKLLFGERLGITLFEILDGLDGFDSTNEIRHCVSEAISPDLLAYQRNTSDCADQLLKSEYAINDELLQPFVYWYKAQEIPARNKLKETEKHFVYDYNEIKNCATRLNKGFSFRALQKIARDISEEYANKPVVSLFIDRAIDEGVIVPINFYCSEHRYFCRAYRHGEDLPFGDADRCRLLFFLSCIMENFDSATIPYGIAQRSLEKMIIIFYQIGLRGIKGRSSIFNRFLGFNNVLLLQARFSVHGAIQTLNRTTEDGKSPQPHVYYEKRGGKNRKEIEEQPGYTQWLTAWLIENGYIESRTDKLDVDHYYICVDRVDKKLNEFNMSNISLEIRNDIRVIAQLLSQWYKNAKTKEEFKQDITVLTSCCDQTTFASALATELHYFQIYKSIQVQQGLYPVMNNEDDTNKDAFIYDDARKALFSGREKYIWFITDEVKAVITKVNRLLDTGLQDTWSDLWNDFLSTNISSSILDDLIREGMGYIYFYFVCYEWLNSGRLYKPDVNSEFVASNDELTECREKYLDLAKKTKLLEKDLFDVFPEIERETSLDKRKEIFCKMLDRAVSISENIVSMFEDEIARLADYYTVTYDAAVIIDISDNQGDTVTSIMELWDRLPEDKSKTRINIVRLDNSESINAKYGIFYLKTKDEQLNTAYLIKLYHVVKECLNDKGYCYSIVLLPNLPPRAVFKHNLQVNISRNVTSFNNKVLSKVSPLLNNNRCLQVLLVDTETEQGQLFKEIEKEGWVEKRIISNDIALGGVRSTQQVYEFIYQKTLNPDNCKRLEILDSNKKTCGTGLMYRHNGTIYGLTCWHIIDNTKKYHYRFGESPEFDLVLLDAEPETRLEARDAVDEIALFEINQDALRMVSSSDILSECDLLWGSDILPDSQEAYCCFGYPDSFGQQTNGIQFIGKVNKGYISMSNGNPSVCSGYSGAAVVSAEGKLVGIHSSSNKAGLLRIVSCESIREKLICFEGGDIKCGIMRAKS